jgi:ATP-dependent exoDNAse (exonuclease V) beta subunit
LPLDKSYRSSQVVIDTVNYVFGSIEKNRALAKHSAAAAKWKESFRRHVTTRTELAGLTRLIAASEESRSAVLRDAAREVAKRAADAPHATIGVLTRTNDAVARMIFELRRCKVNASEEGGNPLIDSPAVTLVLSLLRLADHPHDSASRFHVQGSPLGVALGLDESEARSTKVAQQVRDELVRDGYGACVLRWAELLAPASDAREARRLTQLVRLAHRHDAHPTLRPGDFVSFVEQEKVEDPTSASVRVMTIHQAKGLEFDLVVLVDMDRLLLKNHPPVLVDAPSPTSPPTRVVRYPNETEQAATGGLDGMAEAWRRGAMRENLSLLYVALTRAIHELVVVVQPRKPEAALPLSFAGILTDALAHGKACIAGTTIYAVGDEAWYRTLDAEPGVTMPPVAPAARVQLRPRRDRRTRNLPRTSPSALEGGELVRVSDMLRLDTTALRRGSIVHALFEQIEWLETGVPDDSTLQRVARRAGATEPQAAQLISEFRRMLESPAVRDVLRRATYEGRDVEQVQVHRELSFALRDGDKILTGAVDRLVIRRGGMGIEGVDVLDYKTDHVDAELLADKIEHYRPQLQAYRTAAAHLFHVEPAKVTARLVFVNAGRVEEIR